MGEIKTKRPHTKQYRRNSLDSMQYWISLRALAVLMLAVFAGLILGNVLLGFLAGVLIICWWLIRRFVHDTRTVFRNYRKMP